jgi:hypothetical protein
MLCDKSAAEVGAARTAKTASILIFPIPKGSIVASISRRANRERRAGRVRRFPGSAGAGAKAYGVPGDASTKVHSRHFAAIVSGKPS